MKYLSHLLTKNKKKNLVNKKLKYKKRNFKFWWKTGIRKDKWWKRNWKRRRWIWKNRKKFKKFRLYLQLFNKRKKFKAIKLRFSQQIISRKILNNQFSLKNFKPLLNILKSINNKRLHRLNLFIRNLESRLVCLLARMNFVYNVTIAKKFIKDGFTSINGFVTYNINSILNPNDFIAISPNIHSILRHTFKWKLFFKQIKNNYEIIYKVCAGTFIYGPIFSEIWDPRLLFTQKFISRYLKHL